MKKQFIAGFVSGALICGAIGAGAGVFEAYTNVFPIQLNGENVSIEGYNINGYTYFKLRDIADVAGGFTVGFANDTIQLAKDGYVYKQQTPEKLTSDSDEWTYDVNYPGTDFMIYNFNINSSDAVRMNTEMSDEISFFSSDEIEALESYTFQYGNICSIITLMETSVNDYSTAIARTIDTQTGKEITDGELCAYAGISEEDMKNQLKDELLETYIEAAAEHPSMASDTMKQLAISDDNIGDFFIDDEGMLYVNLNYFSFTGGYHVLYYTDHQIVNMPSAAN